MAQHVTAAPYLQHGHKCPECGAHSNVSRTEGAKRYRKCPECGCTYRTRELNAAVVDEMVIASRTLQVHMTTIMMFAFKLQHAAASAHDLCSYDDPFEGDTPDERPTETDR